jgi:hypothetical protein
MGIPDKNTLLLLPSEILAKASARFTGGSLIANAFRVGLFCLLLSAFLYIGGLPSRVTDDIIPLAQHPLNFSALHEPILARRLTLPLVAHLLHLANRGIIIITIACNFLTLVILYYVLALAMTETLAFLTVMLLSLTTMTIIGNTWLGMPDPISNLMGVASMAAKSPILIAVYAVIGLQSDERFALIIPFILLWHIKDCVSFKTAARRLIPFALSMLVALIATGLIQFFVVGDAVPVSAYHKLTREVWQQHAVYPLNIPLAIFFGFRWAWWLPAFLAIATVKSGFRTFSLILLSLIALEAASAMMVGDMTRSMAQIFPGFVLAIYLLSKLRPDILLRWLPVTIMAMIITPMVDVWANQSFPRYPMPVVLLRKLLEGGRLG